ncbi:MAG: hypothetical protein LBI96_04350 [Odoribacteraceae bacterium]|nr:hypothetical protein [Odoribacteraceae bacterium]
MKKLFVLFLLLSGGLVVQAQQHYRDVVYLKNGSVIRGTIVELVPDKLIKIEMADQSVFVYQLDEVESFAREAVRGNNFRRFPGSDHGYAGIVDMGYGVGAGRYGSDFIHFTMINGYRFNPHFLLGVGTGVKFYHEEEAVLVPFFAHFQATLLDGLVSPYAAASVGYSFNASGDFEGVGLLVNPSVGVHFEVSGNSGINVSVGYDGQWAEFVIYDGHNLDVVYKVMGGVCVKVGFVF